MFGAGEAGGAAQEAPQVAEGTFRRVGRLQPLASGLEARPEERNRSVQAFPELVDGVRLRTRPVTDEVQGLELRPLVLCKSVQSSTFDLLHCIAGGGLSLRGAPRWGFSRLSIQGVSPACPQ